MKNYWTKSKIDKLSSLWAKGTPAREIAEKTRKCKQKCRNW